MNQAPHISAYSKNLWLPFPSRVILSSFYRELPTISLFNPHNLFPFKEYINTLVSLLSIHGTINAHYLLLFIMQKKTYKVVFVRHGESTWNKENKFTGWTDVPLSEKGVQEAKEAGKRILKEGFKFDVCFTSVLKRSIQTFNYIAEEADMHYIPVIKSWRLNERHYGGLQGLNKEETAAKHGNEQVKIWRRSYDIPPPALELSDQRHPIHDEKYASLPKDICPACESLKLTVERALPFWYDNIAPAILSGKRVIVCAHGNSLRAIVKHLDKMSDEAIVELDIPTGTPLVYEFDENLTPIKKYYLASAQELEAKIAAVKKQGEKKM